MRREENQRLSAWHEACKGLRRPAIVAWSKWRVKMTITVSNASVKAPVAATAENAFPNVEPFTVETTGGDVVLEVADGELLLTCPIERRPSNGERGNFTITGFSSRYFEMPGLTGRRFRMTVSVYEAPAKGAKAKGGAAAAAGVQATGAQERAAAIMVLANDMIRTGTKPDAAYAAAAALVG